jgi:hypothetical protein
MANGVFNISKGFDWDWVADDPRVMLLKVAQADATLEDHDTISAILGAANTEADFTNYARTALTGEAISIDDTNNRSEMDANNVTWSSAGGASNNTLVKLIVYLEGGGTDGTRIPVSHHDFAITTNGGDLTAQFDAQGIIQGS